MSGPPLRGLRVAVGGDVVVVRSSERSDGDFSLEVDPVALAHRRAAFQQGRWTQLDEVHGSAVHLVRHPGAADRAIGDSVVSAARGAVLAVWVGDCAPVALVAANGVVGACHAGWRGALDGVLAATVHEMRAQGAGGDISAYLGPCIHGCCYEFGADLLSEFRDRFGGAVASVTSWGTPSLHMPALVQRALAELGIALDQQLSECTACHSARRFSHRRGDAARQVLTVTRMAAA